jgi:hypothetical protein
LGESRISIEDFFSRWNDFANRTPKLKPARMLTKKRIDKLKVRINEDGWFEAFKSACLTLPLGGDGWQPDIDWFIRNDTNAVSMAEGAYEWRNADDPAMQRQQQKVREADARRREQRVAEQRDECAKDKLGARKAINSILRPKPGSNGEPVASSLLFGDEESSPASGAAS